MSNIIVSGKIEAARPYKEGSKLFLVTINGREFKAFDDTYLRKVGAEGDWEYYKKENEWNGVKRIDYILSNIVQSPQKRQYGRPAPKNDQLEKILATVENIEDKLNALYEAILNDPEPDRDGDFITDLRPKAEQKPDTPF